ncbi:MAG TPA: tRNA threonylcarbamoyladenosine dehydratase [Candidatus Omnitrophota bacterium]|nr:tRNA threonylcarbamoyladenosine dehydratase [Candidatus Omnitrophota bacterium]HPS36980.1 tRNA threonylcarbamoyladenosine dehydratase [Candidatus Omnitrophota bacterium]
MGRLFCIELLIGKEKVERLKKSFVVVIGIGAVGSYATEALARSGIGRLRLVDFDAIKETNFNRHILAIEPNLGKLKAEAAKERIAQINPHCNVEAVHGFAAEETMEELLSGTPDLVIDAVDSVNPKTQILEFCHRKKIPVISSMGAALRTDIFGIKAGDLFKTTGCPLARVIRSWLRRRGIRKGIFCVYSDAPVPPEIKARLSTLNLSNEEEVYPRGRQRRKLGSLPTVTGAFGLAVAHYAIRYLTGDLPKLKA